jgi:hypothetical protein
MQGLAFMDTLRALLGWNWRIRRLRKSWDRTRERALKIKDQAKRKDILQKLDTIENNIKVLEEEDTNTMVKGKLVGEARKDLDTIADMISMQREKEEQTEDAGYKIGAG